MSFKPTFGTWLRRARAAVSLLALALGATAGCTAYPTYKSVPVDCSVQNAYDFDNIDAEFMMLFTSADDTPGAVMTAAVTPIPDGALCGDTSALLAQASHNNDWGSLFGFYAFGKKNESTMQGLSFWARAPGNTGKAFTLLMDDSNSYDPYVSCGDGGVSLPPPADSGVACTTFCGVDAGAGAPPPVYNPATGVPISSGTTTAPMAPNACGNDYQVVVQVTSDWRFYTIPFGMFQQLAQPNRVPNSIFNVTGSAPGTEMVTSAIVNMTFRFPKESAEALWIDRLAFYRQMGPGDAGAQGQ